MQSLACCEMSAVIASGLLNAEAQRKWIEWHLEPLTIPMRGNATALYAHLGWHATPSEVLASLDAYTSKGQSMKLSNSSQTTISTEWLTKVRTHTFCLSDFTACVGRCSLIFHVARPSCGSTCNNCGAAVASQDTHMRRPD